MNQRFVYSLLVLLSVEPLLLAADDPITVAPTISVTGAAEIKVAPDRAILRFAIISKEKVLDEAASKNDKIVSDVTDFLKASGVEDKFINTDLIRIHPVYPNQQGSSFGSVNLPRMSPATPNRNPDQLKPIGYSANRRLSITVTDLAKLETIYKGLLSKGVNSIDGVDFETSELRKHRDAARLKAIAAAREKATALVGALDAKLAGVQSIREDHVHFPSPFSASQNSVSFATPMAPLNVASSAIARGEISVNASVAVVFELKETDF